MPTASIFLAAVLPAHVPVSQLRPDAHVLSLLQISFATLYRMHLLIFLSHQPLPLQSWSLMQSTMTKSLCVADIGRQTTFQVLFVDGQRG